jgi:hypothetical protein
MLCELFAHPDTRRAVLSRQVGVGDWFEYFALDAAGAASRHTSASTNFTPGNKPLHVADEGQKALGGGEGGGGEQECRSWRHAGVDLTCQRRPPSWARCEPTAWLCRVAGACAVSKCRDVSPRVAALACGACTQKLNEMKNSGLNGIPPAGPRENLAAFASAAGPKALELTVASEQATAGLSPR